MIKVEFDANNNPIEPTLVIATKSGHKLGRIIAHDLVATDTLSEAPEFTFKTYKSYNDEKNPYYDEIENFRWLWCKEYDCWYECYVTVDDQDGTSKSVQAKRLAEVMLSQTMIFGMHINDEDDIARTDYDPNYPSYFWYAENAHRDLSILVRVLERCPQFTVRHVDKTLADIREVKEFAFDNISVYDAFTQIAQEFHCLFQFDTKLDDEGNLIGYIDAYDLESVCNNPNCSYLANFGVHKRGEFTDYCPECNSTDITLGYGKDTTIFVDKEELGNNIELTTDTDSVKNCFKLVGGDDLVTDTMKNCNANGSDRIWLIPNWMRKDMSSDLQKALADYDDLYHSYMYDKVIPVDSSLLAQYNSLANKYNDSKYDHDVWQTYTTAIKGYPMLMNLIYELIDMRLYLQTAMMPNGDLPQTSAQEEANKLTVSTFQNAAIQNLKYLTKQSAENILLETAKCVVRTSEYSVYIHTDSFSDSTWTGSFEIVNSADEQDNTKVYSDYEKANTSTFEVQFSDDLETYLIFNIQLTINRDSNLDNYEISNKILTQEIADFTSSLELYSVDELTNISKCIDNCIAVLVNKGVVSVGDQKKLITNDPVGSSGLYQHIWDNIYTPLINKKEAIEKEIALRNSETDIVNNLLGIDDNISQSTSSNLNSCYQLRNAIHKELDFQNYLTKYSTNRNLWLEFAPYKREQQWDNSNFISDNLNNAELIQKSLKCIDEAKNDLVKASIPQHSIACDLANLLVIDKFKPLVDMFTVGNFIRVRVNNEIYKLRLVKYTIEYNELAYIRVEFSDVIRSDINVSDQQSLLNNLKTMSSSYDSYKYQAGKGYEGKKDINDWVEKGLDITNVNILSKSHNQSQTWDDTGMWFREYDPISQAYGDKQIRIVNNTLAVTDDNWKTIKTAIGNFYYYDPRDDKIKEAYGVNAETIVGKLILGEELGIYSPTSDGNHMRFNSQGLEIGNGNYVFRVQPDLDNGGNLWSIDRLKNPAENLLRFDSNGNLIIAGTMQANGKDGVAFTTSPKQDYVYEVSSHGELRIRDGDACHFEVTPKFDGQSNNNKWFFRVYQTPNNGVENDPIIAIDHGGNLTVRLTTLVYKGIEYDLSDMLSKIDKNTEGIKTLNDNLGKPNGTNTYNFAYKNDIPDVSNFITADDIPADTNTTYKISGSGNTVTLTGSDGSSTSVMVGGGSSSDTPTNLKTTDVEAVPTQIDGHVVGNVDFKNEETTTVSCEYGSTPNSEGYDLYSNYNQGNIAREGPLNGASVPYVQSGLRLYKNFITSKTSDSRLKKNIQPMGDVSKFYMKLNPVSFDYKDGIPISERDKVCQYGLLAQDVEQDGKDNNINGIIYKMPCGSESNMRKYTNDDTYYNLNYDSLHAFHIKMIQQQQQQIEQLQKQVELLTEKLNEVLSRNDKK